MNAIPEENCHLQLNYVLSQLYSAVKGLGINTTQEVIVDFSVGEPEDLKEYLYTFSVLDEKNVIEKYTEESSWQEEIEIDNASYVGQMPIYVSKFKFKLKPKVLIKYMEDTSRIPKYTLTLDKKRRLILNGKYRLIILQFNSPNYCFMEYCIERQKGTITFNDVIKKSGKKPQRFHAILDNLNIAPNVVDIFFPHVKNSLAEFRMNVTVKDLEGVDINEIRTKRFMKNLPRVKS